MGFRDLEIKNSYSSDDVDVLHEFYVPALSEAIEYKRLTGFFFSSSLAVAARGIINLIENEGKMKIVSSAFLSKKDVESIKKGLKEPEDLIEENMLKTFDEMKNEFIQNHIKALGWLVAKNKLEIKVAILKDEKGLPISAEGVSNTGIFHEKVGVLKDEKGNRMSFSGSINETGAAWQNNIEEFKVFRDWKPSEKKYFNFDSKKFNKFWKNKANRMDVIDIPNAIEDELINNKPDSFSKLKANISRKKSRNDKKIELYDYQKEAVKSWLENDMRGVFEMATGTGKTFTALGSVRSYSKKFDENVIIISCPFGHLIQQWIKEIDKFGFSYPTITCDSTNRGWRNELADFLADIELKNKKNLIVLTTHSTFSSDDFRKIFQNFKKDADIPILVIVDEVHGIGAEKRQEGLLEIYDYRLGLSATPKRPFDPEGTDAIYDYFKGKNKTIVFEFLLGRAINNINPRTNETFLTPYRYIPKFISLEPKEIEEYMSLTRSIVSKYSNANEQEKRELIDNLMYMRADIVKDAEQKYSALDEILDDMGDELKHTIIYCSPGQIDKVMKKCKERNIIAHRFTMEEGTKPKKKYDGLSQREKILDLFGKGDYQVLVAMKCLDEGVDVPPARKAIIMASSSNPREYIQRIGRVIRRYPGKKEAKIYDLIVKPSGNIKTDFKEIEEKIFEKELNRYHEIAKNAINRADAMEKITDMRDELRGW